jgi:hypothetical protein
VVKSSLINRKNQKDGFMHLGAEPKSSIYGNYINAT